MLQNSGIPTTGVNERVRLHVFPGSVTAAVPETDAGRAAPEQFRDAVQCHGHPKRDANARDHRRCVALNRLSSSMVIKADFDLKQTSIKIYFRKLLYFSPKPILESTSSFKIDCASLTQLKWLPGSRN